MTAAMQMVIGPQKTSSRSGQLLDVINPATEQVHAQIPHADTDDVDRAVREARRAFEDGPWSKMLPAERGDLIYKLSDLVQKHGEELALMDSQDMGKPLKNAQQHDMVSAVKFLRFGAGLCDKVRGSHIPCGPDKLIYMMREPVGVVVAITPWNFPLVMATQKISPALACGNVVILKPAEQSPRSTLRLGELALEAGIPPGVINVVTGLGETTGAALTAHKGVDKISFTGSTAVGKIIMHAAAEQISKVTVELGGKTANIIMPDADFDAALASTVFTSCYNSGQICTTGSRLVVNRKIHDKFIDALTEKMGTLKVGDPMNEDTKLGPLVSREQYNKVNGYIALGKEHYSPIELGVRDPGLNRGYYVNPIVFDHVDPADRIAQEEIFGPVLSVIDFEDEQQAVHIANQTNYGLATAIWTNDLGRAHRMAAKVDSSFVWINCNNFWMPSIPYEGHRQSGVGVDMGVESVESYTKLKNVIVNLDQSPHPWIEA